MNRFAKKLNNNEGFTLVEMLIVVAIIAILIAISIPLVSTALEKAKHATDAANERSAKAAMMIKYLDGSVTFTSGKSGVYAYDAKDGDVDTSKPTTGYGQHKGRNQYSYIEMQITDAGVVTMHWNKTGTDATGALSTSDLTGDSDLCSNFTTH